MNPELTGSVQGDPLRQPLFIRAAEPFPVIIDTSTLIYLDRIELLDSVLAVFSPVTIFQVILEFGRHPENLHLLQAGAGETDRLLVQAAADMGAVVLSEDRQLLQAARRQGLRYYNTLMLVLALYSRKELSRVQCAELLARLKSFARYSRQVQSYGQQLFERLVLREEG